jgi:hypothetical protein
MFLEIFALAGIAAYIKYGTYKAPEQHAEKEALDRLNDTDKPIQLAIHLNNVRGYASGGTIMSGENALSPALANHPASRIEEEHSRISGKGTGGIFGNLKRLMAQAEADKGEMLKKIFKAKDLEGIHMRPSDITVARVPYDFNIQLVGGPMYIRRG